MTNQENRANEDNGRKYAAFTHSFHDPWAGDGEEGSEVSLTFHFAKPTKADIKRLQDTAARNASQASRNLLLSIIRPEEKENLVSALEDYPGIAASFSEAIVKGVGISADLGN